MSLKKIREKLKWIDPFTYVDKYLIPKVNPKGIEYLNWIIYILSAFFFAWLIYTVLGLAFGTGSPMVIVVSGSMEPVYHRGDVIVLFGANENNVQAPEINTGLATLDQVPFSQIATPEYEISDSGPQIKSIRFNNGTVLPIEKTGSIIVYFSQLSRKPIIHRAVAKLKASDGYYLLTKGDSVHNNSIDQDCGLLLPAGPQKNCIELYPVPVSNLDGIAVLQIPVVGCVKLWVFDNLGSLITKGKLPSDFSGVC